MRTFLKTISQFGALTMTVYVLLICIWGELLPQYLKPNLNYKLGAYGHMHTRARDVASTGSVDILVLGSSHAYRGLDPRIFKEHGLNMFNLGSSSQSPIQSEILLNRHIDRLKPKLVLYEVNPLTFRSDGVESSLDLLANDRFDIHSVVMLSRVPHIKTFNTFIYSIYANLTGKAESFSESPIKDEDEYISGGFVQRKMEYNTSRVYKPRTHEISAKQLRSFQRTISAMMERGIDVRLIQAPMTSSFYRANLGNGTFDSTMSSVAEYLNFNELMDLDDSLHFYDAHHLNQEGVEIFNEALIEKLGLKR